MLHIASRDQDETKLLGENGRVKVWNGEVTQRDGGFGRGFLFYIDNVQNVLTCLEIMQNRVIRRGGR